MADPGGPPAPLPGTGPDLLAAVAGVAGIGADDAFQNAQQGRFTGSVGPQQQAYFPRGNVKVQSVQGDGPAVAARESAHRQPGFRSWRVGDYGLAPAAPSSSTALNSGPCCTSRLLASSRPSCQRPSTTTSWYFCSSE